MTSSQSYSMIFGQFHANFAIWAMRSSAGSELYWLECKDDTVKIVLVKQKAQLVKF